MRYGAVAPSRSTGGQRVYSDDDTLRLSCLRRVVLEGRSLSLVTPMPTGELQGLVRQDEVQRYGEGMLEPLVDCSVAIVLERASNAVGEMDSKGLERMLARGAMALSVSTVIDGVIVPLLSGFGPAWKAGRIVTMLDLELGVGWTGPCDRFRLRAGYLISGWLNTVRTDEWIDAVNANQFSNVGGLSLIHISEPTRLKTRSRMPSSA